MKEGYEIAKSMIGLHENKDTSTLNNYIRAHCPSWRPYSVNKTPWCAAIMNAWEQDAGGPLRSSLAARSFLKVGEEVPLKEAKNGDIVVFSRGGSSWQGHVAYFEGLETSRSGRILVKTIGGNQSDSVSYGWYPKERLLGVRRT